MSKHWLAAIAAVGMVCATGDAFAQNVALKMSVPAGRAQVRGQVAEQFAQEVARATNNRVAIEIFFDSQLFRGAEEPRALASGALDFTTPNLGLVGSIEPNADLLAMPSFSTATGTQVRAVMDGPAGRDLVQRLESRMRVKVLGDGYEFAPDALFTKTKEPKTFADLNGLKIRAPGGPKYTARLRTMGAIATFMAFEDLHLALSQGVVDGLLTNHAGVVQGKFWEVGVKYGIDLDLGWSVMMPMMSATAWGRLGADNQRIMTETWARMLPGFRKQGEDAIVALRKQITDAGITLIKPSDADIAALRARLLAAEGQVATETMMDAAFVTKYQAELRAAQSR
jgi:TRAP-type transport system periplasmic protein